MNYQQIGEMNNKLDSIEKKLLQHQFSNNLVDALFQVGYWANELLQIKSEYEFQQQLLAVIKKVEYLQKLCLKNVIKLQTVHLANSLKKLISDKAWKIFLKLDELRSLEIEYFQDKSISPDFNLDLSAQEQELKARMESINFNYQLSMSKLNDVVPEFT